MFILRQQLSTDKKWKYNFRKQTDEEKQKQNRNTTAKQNNKQQQLNLREYLQQQN